MFKSLTLNYFSVVVNASVVVETRNYSTNTQFLILVVLDLSDSHKLSVTKLHMTVCQYILTDLYKVDKVIVQQPAAFIQSNDNQIFCMENSLHTNDDIIVNTAFKELKSLL